MCSECISLTATVNYIASHGFGFSHGCRDCLLFRGSAGVRLPVPRQWTVEENNLGDAGLKRGIDRNVRLDREDVASEKMEYSFWGWCQILLFFCNTLLVVAKCSVECRWLRASLMCPSFTLMDVGCGVLLNGGALNSSVEGPLSLAEVQGANQ